MELNQVMKIRLYPTPDEANAFAYLCEQYRLACDFVSRYVFDNGFELNSNTLSKTLYREVRETFALKSQLAQSAFRTVTARYKTVRTQLWQKPYKYQDETGKRVRIQKDLDWLQRPVRFRRPQADLVRNRDYSFVDGGQALSLNTLAGRVRMAFSTKGFDQYLDGSWSLGTAKLVQSGGKWFLHVSISKEVSDFQKEDIRHVVGIDRGLNFLLTTYDEQGKTGFADGRKIMRKRDTYNRVRAELQAKGTKSAKRRLQKLAQRENRWMTDVNHRLSKTLLDQYGEGTLFVLEDLADVTFSVDHLGKKQRNRHRSWAFYQFGQFLAYKSDRRKALVLEVDAHYTSQRCPKCGTIDKEHREKQTHSYWCKQCGYHSNDDRVGAMNIQLLGTRWVSGVDAPRFEKVKPIG